MPTLPYNRPRTLGTVHGVLEIMFSEDVQHLSIQSINNSAGARVISYFYHNQTLSIHAGGFDPTELFANIMTSAVRELGEEELRSRLQLASLAPVDEVIG